MQDRLLFEYAVIRIVPKVELEEFLNTGVVLYCAGKKFLQMQYVLDLNRLQVFCNGCDVPEVEENLRAFEQICKGGEGAGPIGNLPIAERFRWLTATRSTVIQTSKVHPGFCKDPSETLNLLFKKLVSGNS